MKFLGFQPGQVLDPVNFTTIPKHIFTLAADISYYQRFDFDGESNKLELGAAIINLGPKINVSGNDQKTFLPTNLGIGISYTNNQTETGNQFTVPIDANKLLVPTPPQYDINGDITACKDPNRSVLNALFSSFNDAPQGFKEELDISVSMQVPNLCSIKKFHCAVDLVWKTKPKATVNTLLSGLATKE